MTDITENDKYYVPTIDEIHPGFECEGKILTIERTFHKGVISLIGSELWFTTGDSATNYNATKIRVKHLDHDDIISIGWTFSESNNKYELNGYNMQGYSYKYKYLSTIKIYKQDTEHVIRKLLFDGVLRNKSELKRLINQLRITV